MAISIHCDNPDCLKPLRVKDELAGKRLKCPACGHIILVAALSSTSQITARSDADVSPLSKHISDIHAHQQSTGSRGSRLVGTVAGVLVALTIWSASNSLAKARDQADSPESELTKAKDEAETLRDEHAKAKTEVSKAGPPKPEPDPNFEKDLPTRPAFGLIEVAQIKNNLKEINEMLKAAGMNDKYVQQFDHLLDLAVKTGKDGKFETSKYKEDSFAVITGRMKDMIDASQMKREFPAIRSALKDKRVEEKLIQQFETRLNQAIEAASEGKFSIRDHKDKSFSRLYQQLSVEIKKAGK